MSVMTAYTMNPAEDEILYGDALAEGMLVLREDEMLRPGSEASEDVQLRGQRFCRVTRLRTAPGDLVVFVGEWVDGYQQTQRVHASWGWIVKRDSMPANLSQPDSTSEEGE